MASSKNLRTAVDKAFAKADKKADTGNVATSDAPPQVDAGVGAPPKNPAPQPGDLPTGEHSRR